jgi:hypothetical protein
MGKMRRLTVFALLIGTILVAQNAKQVPSFKVDPFWPKPLPNRWLVGAVAGVALDSKDHVWIIHRPSTLQPNEIRASYRGAPPVLEFDPKEILSPRGAALERDMSGRSWSTVSMLIQRTTSGSPVRGTKDNQILKFTRDGKFSCRSATAEKTAVATIRRISAVRQVSSLMKKEHELYVADGYLNHRVIVFDAETGAYKRHWGAYGRKPDDSYFENAGERLPGPFNGAVQREDRPSQYDPAGPPPPQFRVVHAVRISNDGLVYVCDRTNDRIQVFKKDGTFVREAFIAKETLGSGSVWDIAFSPDRTQKFLIVPDGTIKSFGFLAVNRWRLSASSEVVDTGPVNSMARTILRPIPRGTST